MFKNEDFKFVKSIGTDPESQREVKTGFINVLKKLRIAFRKRAWQAKVISKHLAECDHPFIVCGDFNDAGIGILFRNRKLFQIS